jgi:small GTP-binding protein
MAAGKVVLIGDNAVGKTTLIRGCDEVHDSTIGCDTFPTTVRTAEGREVSITLWDTAGQDAFNTLVPLYLKHSQIAVIVTDLSASDPLESVQKWVDLVREGPEQPVLLLVQNKMDLADGPARAAALEGAREKFGDDFGMTNCFQTSAATREGVPQLLEKIAEILCQKMPEGPAQRSRC